MPPVPPRPRVPFASISELELRQGTTLANWDHWKDGQPLTAREIVSLTGLCNTLLMDSRKGMRDCAVAYMTHLSILRRTSLSQRPCEEITIDELKQAHLDHFLGYFNNVCASIVESVSDETTWDAFDLLDGRILRHVLRYMDCLQLPRFVTDEVCQFATLINELTGVDTSSSIPSCSPTNEAGQDAGVGDGVPTSGISFATGDSVSPSVLSFSNQALDEYLAPINVTTQDATKLNTGQPIFQEVSHWHNAKSLLSVKRTPPPLGFYAMRRNQRLMTDIIAYSASLTGKAINPEVIASVATLPKDRKRAMRREEPERPKQACQAKAKKPPSKGGRENAQKEAQKVRQEKLDSQANVVLSAWGERCREFETEANLESRYLKTTKYLGGLSHQQMAIVGGEVSLYQCNVLASMILSPKISTAVPSKLRSASMLLCPPRC